MYDALRWCATRREVEVLLMRLRGDARHHYVYVLHRSNSEPFYVGKGQSGRIFEHEVEATGTSRRTHKLNVIRSVRARGQQLQYSIHSAFRSHELALDAECKLIRKIGRYDQGKGPLTNQTDGGEGAVNPSDETKERHRQTLAGAEAEDPDRAAANVFFAKFCAVDSTPIKPVTSYGRSISTLHRNRNYIGMKPRNAGALIAMAVAQGQMINAGVELTRRFSFGGRTFILENGCGRDMLVNGMIEVSGGMPKDEIIRITDQGASYILANHERRALISFGVLQET